MNKLYSFAFASLITFALSVIIGRSDQATHQSDPAPWGQASENGYYEPHETGVTPVLSALPTTTGKDPENASQQVVVTTTTKASGETVVTYEHTESLIAISYVQSIANNELTMTLHPGADPGEAALCLGKMQYASLQDGTEEWLIDEGFPRAFRWENGVKKKVPVDGLINDQCLQLVFDQYPENKEVIVELGVRRPNGTEKTTNGCGPAIGSQTTVSGFAPYPTGGSYNWIIIWGNQNQLNSYGYCVQRNQSAPNSGATYEVTNTAHPNFPHSATTATNMAAAMSALEDPAVNGDAYIDNELNQALWAFEGTMSSNSLDGTALTIYNNVINGTYQPVEVVWFKPISNSGHQWYIARAADCDKDYGDAPSSYGDASHDIVTGVRMGAQVDGEDDSIHSGDADGDDNDGNDDEDGVTFLGAVAGCTGTAGNSEQVTIEVKQNQLNNVYLNGWIDFNKDGDFDSGERIIDNFLVGNNSNTQSFTFTYTVPTDAALGKSYARFRFSDDPATSPSGYMAGAGEVEDYVYDICSTSGNPSSFDYTCQDGVEVDCVGEGIDGQTSASLTIPDAGSVDSIWVFAVHKNGTPPATVTFSTASETLIVPAETVINAPGGNTCSSCRIYQAMMAPAASVSINTNGSTDIFSFVAYTFKTTANGGSSYSGLPINEYFYKGMDDFDLPIEPQDVARDVTLKIPITEMTNDSRVVEITLTAGGQTTTASYNTYDPVLGASLLFAEVTLPNVPANSSTINVKINSPFSGGDSFLVGGLLVAENNCVSVEYDYGDAPDCYGDFGIATDIGSPSWLGGAPDAESNSQYSAQANGDDNNGSDDEDGVTFVGGNTMEPGTTKELTISWETVDYDAFIYGWIDFNGNCAFETNERVINNFEVGNKKGTPTGSHTFDIHVPSDATCGLTYARFYIHSDQNIPASGLFDNDGEVEDYQVELISCPTPVGDPQDITYDCGENVKVDQIGVGAKCEETTVVTIPNSANVFQYAVEIVYKGGNPGSTIIVEEMDGDKFQLARTQPAGTSSNVWVYRGLITGSTPTLTYTDQAEECKLQSIVVYPFRNQVNDLASVVEFTALTGYRDVQTFTIDLPTNGSPRDLTLNLPISELTTDCRLLTIGAQAGGVVASTTIEGPDNALGNCCLNIVTLNLNNVPGSADEITVTLTSPTGSNSTCPSTANQNGQSYTVAGLVEVELECTDCDINTPEITTFCHDNGTPTDPSDDTFTYTIKVSGADLGATYSISGDDNQSGLAYGVINGPFGPFAIANGDLNIAVTDSDDSACTESATVQAPSTCSDECALDPATILATCDDNGTPSDPSDDTFSYTIELSGSNTSATYNISGDDSQNGLSYNTVNGPFGPFPINGGDLIIHLTDNGDNSCSLENVLVDAPASCSDECALNTPSIATFCDDNGTPSDPSDDTFTYFITTTGSNTSGTYKITGDDSQNGLSYGVLEGPFGPFNIADGDLTIQVQDSGDAGCSVDGLLVEAPAACSNTCNLNPPTILATCDDKGTPSDPSDDTYTYTIQLSGQNTGATYSISGDDSQNGLAYNTVNGPFGPFAISNGSLTITITDAGDPACQILDANVIAPTTCSDECELLPPSIIVTCHDNGTPANPNDDTFTYLISVDGNNTGSGYAISGDDTQSGLAYANIEGPFGPFLIADGDLNIVVSDNEDPSCNLMAVTIEAPESCSDQCDLNIPVIVSTCDDNGTPSDPSDDTFTYTIEVNGDNTGVSYSISGDDNQSGLAYNTVNGPFGPFPISGGSLVVTITDSVDPGCEETGFVVAPTACSNECDLNTPSILTFCDDNGTPFDPSDDTFTYAIEVTGVNVGSSYAITGDDTRVGLLYGTIEGPFGPFAITNGNLTLTITDVNDPNCEVMEVTVVAPADCSDNCNLNPPSITTQCFDSGTPSDPSDDTFTYTITMTGANTGANYTVSGDDNQSSLVYNIAQGPFGPFAIADGDLSLIVTDNSDPNCQETAIVIAPPTCSDVCDLEEPVIITNCDDNGTPSDPSDDTFTYLIQVDGANTASTYTVTGDDVQNGLAYGSVNGPFGPFSVTDGDLSITVIDANDPNCSASLTVKSPGSCSGVCNLEPPAIATLCDDNGTPSDPSDDTFTYTIEVNGSNTAATYTVSGDDSQNGLAYNVVNGPFGPFPIADGNLVLTITDNSDPNCQTIGIATAPATCSDECLLDPPAILTTCDDNGTPSDPSDDTFTYTIQVVGVNTGVSYAISGDHTQANLAYNVVNGPFGPFPISGGDLTITITDSEDANCLVENEIVAAPPTCSDECFLLPPVINTLCDDNGTPSDPSDDTYTYTIQQSGVNTGNTFNITGDDIQANLAYDVVNGPFGPFPVLDGDLTIVITDSDDPFCQLPDVPVNAPNTCSDVCDLNPPIITAFCDDNNTPSDPTDDTFTYTIQVTGANTGASYSISGDDTQAGLAYNVVNGPFGPFSIEDGDLIITITDNENASCNLVNEIVSAPNSCSGECNLSPPTVVTVCNDNGTPSDPSDDTFTYTVELTGSNLGGTFSVSGDDTQSSLTYNIVNGPYGPFPIADGDLVLTLTDSADPNCQTVGIAVAPEACSDQCDLGSPLILATCNDNGTPFDPTDDTFTYTVELSGVNVGSSYSISGDDTQAGLQYGLVNGPFGPFNIADGDLTITLTDSADPTCQVVDATVTAPTTCSDQCQLMPPVILANCSDNGTPSDPSDDTFTFTVQMPGVNTSSSYLMTGDVSATGLVYGIVNGPFGPFPIAGGDLTINLVDSEDANCLIPGVTVVAPSVCSDACLLDEPTIITACDDNGTPSNPNDDTFTYTIQVTGVNTGASYSVSGDDTQTALAYYVVNGPFGPFPISGGDLSLLVTDAGDSACTEDATAEAPVACSDECDLDAPMIVAICDDNGTPSNPNDDTFTYTIQVSGDNTGGSYSISGDDVQGGLAYDVVNGPFGPFPIGGGDLSINITDNDDGDCQLIDVAVNAPATCSDVCDLDNPVFFVECDDNGTPFDPADDTFTYTIQVTGANTGATYSIAGDDTQTGLAYNVVNGPFGPFSITAGDLALTVIDGQNVACTVFGTVDAPESCSDQCNLNAPIIVATCNDNGTPSDASDDTFTFTIEVNGSNTGSSYLISGDYSQGGLAYGVVNGPYGPFTIAEGDLSINITDADDPNCQLIDIAVNAPQTCSDVCDLDEPVILVDCDDNGTPNDPADDTYTYTIQVTGVNTAGTYTISGDDTQTGLAYNVVNGPFGPFNITDGNLDITVADAEDAQCVEDLTIEAPAACSDQCSLDPPVIVATCDDNGTPSDPTDDFFTYTIELGGENVGASYDISGDDSQTGLAYDVVNGPFGPFPMDGGDLSITLTDGDDANCQLIDNAVNAPDACDVPTDYGDAPMPYGNAGHVIDDHLNLGIAVDSEASSQNSPDAQGDDNNGDDEDGVVFLTNSGNCFGAPGSTQNIEISVENNTGSDAYLSAWIDFDGNGMFDLGDAILSNATIAPLAGLQTIGYTYSIPADAMVGATYARFRLSNDPIADPMVLDTNGGEVEDYACTIGDIEYDFGDNPSSYGSFGIAVNSGTPSWLGSAPDADPNMQSNPMSDGDDNDGNDDEDGVTFIGGPELIPGTSKEIALSWTTFDADAYIYAWIDFNQDGDYDPNELVINEYPVGSGTTGISDTGNETFTVDVPVDAVCGMTYARFYIHDDTGIEPIGLYSDDGEVEDYALTVNSTVEVTPSPDLTNCQGGSVTLFATASGGTGPYTYTWDNGLGVGTLQTVMPSETTTYTVTVTDVYGCEDIDSVTITIRDLDEPVIITNCNDNGTPFDPADDTFMYTIQVTGANTSGTYNISGDDSQTGLAYNVVNGPFGPFNIVDGNLDIVINDGGTPPCAVAATVEAPAACSDQCSLDPPVIVASCDDNGTPTDPSDDTFTYTISVGGENTGTSYTIMGDDAQSNLAYNVVNGPFGPFPIAGGDLSITITDADDPNCQLVDMAVNAPQTCSDVCDLDEPVILVDCDDNGTPFDPADDTYTYTIQVTGVNTAGTYNVSGDDTQSGLAYNVVNGPYGPFLIADGNLDITVTDGVDPQCTVEAEVEAPAACSDQCSLDPPVIVATCDDNGTPTDPSDDTFTYTISVGGENTGTSYTITGDDAQSGLAYNVVNGPFGPFPIAGGDLSITITDADDPNCQLVDLAVNAPQTCSDLCVIETANYTTTCHDNGTPSDPSDDVFYYTIEASGVNTAGSFNIIGDDIQTGLPFNIVNGPYGPFNIADGDLEITLEDAINGACTAPLTIEAPAPCSNNCALDTPVVEVKCDDNGTPFDPSDDIFFYLVTVTGDNTGATYSISGDDVQTGLAYGMLQGEFGPFSIADGAIELFFNDDTDPACQAIVVVEPPMTCSTDCAIEDIGIVTVCDDAGTPSDPSDDIYQYYITVTGSQTAATYSISGDDTQTGLTYGVQEGPFGFFAIGNGILSLTVTDDDDPDCEQNTIVVPPASCSDDCAIDEPFILTECDDNGTPADPSDDTFTYFILANGNNVSSSYSVSGDDTQSGLTYGQLEGPFGPFPISDGDLNITLIDAVSGACSLNTAVEAPADCSNDCSLNEPMVLVDCDDNGTPNNPSDDTFTFTILVNGNNTGATYNISGEFNASGLAYNVTNGPFGPFLISQGDRTLVITDNNDPSCTTMVTVEAPDNCSDDCGLFPPSIGVICDDNGTPSDPSDDVFYYQVFVLGSNTSAGYLIAGDDFQAGLSYGQLEGPFGPFPISGGMLFLDFIDAGNPSCSVQNVPVLPPTTCSFECSLEEPLVSVNCHDNGTPNDPSDDNFTFTILVDGNSTGIGYTVTGDVNLGAQQYGVVNGPFGPFPISGGNLNLIVTDLDDPFCTTETEVEAPNSCVPNNAAIGNFVWEDLNGNGLQDIGEPGIPNVTVTLTGTDVFGNSVTATTTTDANGFYLFTDLTPGTYKVTFDTPGGYQPTLVNVGSDDELDSDADPAMGGMTDFTVLSAGETNLSFDAGYILPGSLGNYVWEDINGDGTQDPNEPGIPGVEVVLTGFDGAGNFINLITFTDNNGFYLFDNLTPGSYKVTFLTPPGGYVLTGLDASGDDATDSDADPAMNGMTIFEELESGETNLTYDAGYFIPSSLGDFVWEDTNGNGQQDPGEAGIPDVIVTLIGINGLGEIVVQADTTDANGNYSFTGLTPGEYKVTFEQPNGYAYSPLDATGNDANDSDANPAMNGMTVFEVLVSGEHNTDYDAGFIPDVLGSIGDFVWEDQNGNGIQDPGEPGIPGVTVVLEGTDNLGNPVNLTTTTDINGFYLFDNLPAGTYKLTFQTPTGYVGTTPNVGGNESLDSDADPAMGGMTDLEVLEPGEVNTSYDAGYYIPGSISDYVWEDTDFDGVQDPDEPGIPGIIVNLYFCGEVSNGPVATTVTNADGWYEFTGLLPASYTVEFVLPDGGTYVFTTTNLGGDDELDSDANEDTGFTDCIELESGEDEDNVDAGLVPCSSIGLLECVASLELFLDENCEAVVDPSALIDGEAPCYLNLGVVVVDENGEEIPGGIITVEYIGQTIVATVTDTLSGNSCSTDILVLGSNDPILDCPADTVISCVNWADGLGAWLFVGNYDVLDEFGTIGSEDGACPGEVEYEVAWSVDMCMVGTIERTWTVVDDNGNATSSCSQVIYLEHISDFVVEFPADSMFNCTDLPVTITGEPEIFFDECELVAVSYDDVNLPVVGDACTKLMRTWLVVNWCQFELYGYDAFQELSEIDAGQDFDGDGDLDAHTFMDGVTVEGEADGYITYNQIIKVIDNEGPVFDVEDFVACVDGPNCVGTVELPIPDVDDCSDDISIQIITDLPNGSGFGPYTEVPAGEYYVLYNVTDNCGNVTGDLVTVTVTDCAAPMIQDCPDIIMVFLNPDGTADLTSENVDIDVEAGNCTLGETRISFSTDVNDTMRLFDCSDLGQQMFEVWVTGPGGGQEVCETMVIVQDILGACGGFSMVAGRIYMENGVPVQHVDLDLNQGAANYVSDQEGLYHFANLETGNDVEVVPSRTDWALNGVTTLDLVLIKKHILGTDPLSSPYQMIAADVNNTGTITTLDVLNIHQMILQINNGFPAGSWKFVDASYVFPDPTNPWLEEFPESIAYHPLVMDELYTDFIAVKLGDVNGSAKGHDVTGGLSDRTNGRIQFQTLDREVEAGERVTLPFSLQERNLLAYQFTLDYDESALAWAGFGEGFLGVDMMNDQFATDGQLTFAWSAAEAKSFDHEQPQFTLQFVALEPLRLREVLQITGELTTAVAYGQNGQAKSIDLGFGLEDPLVLAGYELGQNVPNPFRETTSIAFVLPQGEEVQLTVWDLSGRVLHQEAAYYEAGEHQIELNNLSGQGVLYYQLRTENFTKTMKMIRLD